MINENLIIAISTFLGAMIGIIPGTYAIYAQRREKRATSQRAEAEARRLTDEITERVLERAKSEIADLTEENMTLRLKLARLEAKYDSEIASLARRVAFLTNGVRLLCCQIRELGHDPVFDLDEEDEEPER